ncbi:hypothetical protein K438DRAFT_2057881, partial [Mycena galopus ATCC 62051]
NCCTTDTSTWRRSNLSSNQSTGIPFTHHVLCSNKCSFIERTHAHPSPEQFLHSHGPLASSTLHVPAAAAVG